MSILPGLDAVPRLPAGLAARRRDGRCHCGRLSGPAGDGVRDGGGAAAGGRAVGGAGAAGRLRGAGLVAAAVGGSRVDHGADDRDRAGAAGGRRPRPLRRAGGGGGAARRSDLLCRRPDAHRISGRPAVPSGADRLHDRCRGHHDRRANSARSPAFRSRATNSSTRCGRSSSGLGGVHWPTIVLSVAVLVVLLTLARVVPRLPGPLIAILLATAVVAVFSLDRNGIRVIGEIPERPADARTARHSVGRPFGAADPGRWHRDRRVLRQRADGPHLRGPPRPADRRERGAACAGCLQRRNRPAARVSGELQRQPHRARRRARQPHPALLGGHAGASCSS